MQTKERKLRARKTWIATYEKLDSVTKAARRCGIPRSTLYRWVKRYEEQGEAGLLDIPQRPKHLAKQKITDELEQLILSIRKKFKFGPQRIQTHLDREQNIQLSAPTIWRVLNKHHVKPLKKYRPKKDFKRYSRPTPGDRVQLDVCKIKQKCYQFTAVDDCTRMRVLRLYSSKHAKNTVLFLYAVLESLPFPIQRIQTDWGTEFFNNLFQEELSIHFIKYRPIKPRSPHLNGKVERSQKTDKAEFYSQINLKDPNLDITNLLAEWEHYYNYKRPHASLSGKTPYEQFLALQEKIPMQGEVTGAYWDSTEVILPRNSDYYKFVKTLKEENIDQ